VPLDCVIYCAFYSILFFFLGGGVFSRTRCIFDVNVSRCVCVLQTLLAEYREFAVKIDELNEVGSVYDALLKGADITTQVTRSKDSASLTALTIVMITMTVQCYVLLCLDLSLGAEAIMVG